MNPRVLHVATNDRSLTTFLMPHLLRLRAAGYAVEVACRLGDTADRLAAADIPAHHIPFERSPLALANLGAYRRLLGVIRQGGYQIVHGHMPVAGALARLAARRAGVPCILYTAHGFYFHAHGPRLQNALYYLSERLLARTTTGIITINDEDFRAAQRWSRRQGPPYIYRTPGMGIDTGAYGRDVHLPTREAWAACRGELGLTADDVVVGTVGACTPRKRHGDLLRAAAVLAPACPQLKVLIVGDGVLLEREKALAGELDLEGRCIFTGFRRDAPTLLSCMDIYVQTSLMEGLPVSVLEAMASSLPVVASRVRGNRDLVEAGVNGYLYPPRDWQELAHLLERLLGDEELRARMGEAGRSKALAYDVSQTTAATLRVYADVLARIGLQPPEVAS
ncbi:MAG: glycosyltransferase family 1 protein [Caldilineae bacterium]|nr:MAG: glycosyltransferase family 1 protein [Caldilineae bacterium]